MLHLVWIRESVNSMLPVARIGGEVVSFRLMRRRGLRGSTAAASLVVDMQLTLISQLMFTMVGIGFLFAHAASGTLRLAADLAWGIVALTPLLVLFALVQHASPFERHHAHAQPCDQRQACRARRPVGADRSGRSS